MEPREFDNVPPFAGRTWREITRWLARNGFEPVKPQQIKRAGCRNYTDSHGGSAIWLRRRPGLMIEAVRIDVLGHAPDPERQDGTLHSRFTTQKVGWGEPRHLHKEAFPPAEEEAYLTAPTPGVIRYSDAGVVSDEWETTHIRIRP